MLSIPVDLEFFSLPMTCNTSLGSTALNELEQSLCWRFSLSFERGSESDGGILLRSMFTLLGKKVFIVPAMPAG